MSAYIVNRAHIAAMVHLALYGPTDRTGGPGNAWALQWFASDPREAAAEATDSDDYFRRIAHVRREITRDNAQRVAYMLMVANVASVSHRYPDDKPADLPGPRPAYWTDDPPTFDIAGARRFTAVHGLSMLAGYEYQACELPGWTGSEAARFLDALKDALIRALPGYNDGPWTIDDDEPEPSAPVAPEPAKAGADRAAAIADAGRAATIAAIRDALRRRTGRPWSVTGGRGTAWGWIRIDAPPRRKPGQYADMTDDDRATLADALAVKVYSGGVSIPAGSDYWAEYIDRAEGRTPTRYGVQYWD